MYKKLYNSQDYISIFLISKLCLYNYFNNKLIYLRGKHNKNLCDHSEI